MRRPRADAVPSTAQQLLARGLACSTTAGAPSCNGTTCSYVCTSNRQDCNGGAAPDKDGCECAGTGCCGTGCQTIRHGGIPSPANYYGATLASASAAATNHWHAEVDACAPVRLFRRDRDLEHRAFQMLPLRKVGPAEVARELVERRLLGRNARRRGPAVSRCVVPCFARRDSSYSLRRSRSRRTS